MGLDTDLLSQISWNSTTRWEQSLVDKIDARRRPLSPDAATGGSPARPSVVLTAASAAPPLPALRLPVEGTFPSLAGATDWINSAPLSAEGLRGKVVLVDFWTYSCINCLRTLPYLKAWADKYREHFRDEEPLVEQALYCAESRLVYPIVSDIPILLIDEALPAASIGR